MNVKEWFRRVFAHEVAPVVEAEVEQLAYESARAAWCRGVGRFVAELVGTRPELPALPAPDDGQPNGKRKRGRQPAAA